MITSVWEDIKREFSFGNMVTRLVIINVAVFVAVIIVKLIFSIMSGGDSQAINGFQDFFYFFCMSTDEWHVLTHPWVPLTSMFLHEGLWHILWNMLFLYWFGRIVGGFIGDHHILPIYLLSGLVAAVAYYLSINFIYQIDNSFAWGASGGVNGIILAAAVIAPDYIIRLLFIGEVRLKYIVAVLLFIDIIGIANNSNTGGHFAHLGGALFGWFYIYQLRNGGTDLSNPVNRIVNSIGRFFESIFNFFRGKKSKLRVEYRNPNRSTSSNRRSMGFGKSRKPNRVSDTEDLSHQEKLDAILDKINTKGMDSLSEEEKDFLYNASKK